MFPDVHQWLLGSTFMFQGCGFCFPLQVHARLSGARRSIWWARLHVGLSISRMTGHSMYHNVSKQQGDRRQRFVFVCSRSSGLFY